MEDAEHHFALNRAAIEHGVRCHIAAWEARDAAALGATLHPKIEAILPGSRWQGYSAIQPALSAQLAGWPALRIYTRRLLIDVAQQAAAIEWVGRCTQSDESGCQEILGATVLDFDTAGLVCRWRTYLDPVRRSSLSNIEASLPDEGWSPCLNPGPPPSPAGAEQLIRAYGQAWSSHDLTQFNGIIHDEIVLQPPWDYVVGRTALEAGAQVYFANYIETQVTPQRFIFDPDQPHFGVCEQTFACTNPDTGQRGQDHDFAFFEIAQGKLRYWRTYFDTSRSVQVVEKTIGFLRR